jgi:hypothetical protein
MEEIKIELPLCNQYDKAHDESWAYRMCGPCSLWMLIKHKNPDFKLSPLEVRDKLIALGGYLENVGFKHGAMAKLGNEYGLNLKYAEKFFYTPEEKEKGAEIIKQNLEAGQPVIVSVFYKLDPAKGGHMVVVNGFQEFHGQVVGYDIQDPDSQFKSHNYFLTKQEFLAGWRGGMIYSEGF